jgi:hypothetical protein
MKLLQEVSRQIRTKIFHPLNYCLNLKKKKATITLAQQEYQVQSKHSKAGSDFYCCSPTRSLSPIPSPTISTSSQTPVEQQVINFNNCQRNTSTATPTTITLASTSPLLSPLPTFTNSASTTNPQLGKSYKTMASTPVGNDEALLASARAFIPSLTNAMHKGQAGRIAVIGGSEEYTGAPYFAAISALKVGADLAHVFCVKNASPVIKSYSPELIVHPMLDSDNAVEQIMEWAPKFNCFLIGCGLGRDPKILNVVAQIIEKLREMDKPLIIDADGLFLITNKTELIRNYPKVIYLYSAFFLTS